MDQLEQAAIIAAEKFFGLNKTTPDSLRRCLHGMYDPHADQHYCTVCNPVPIPSDAPMTKAEGSSGVVLVKAKDAKLPDPLARYRETINKALAYTKTNLHPEDFDDLKQEVDSKLSRLVTKYGDRMNERLVYRIARNTAATFVMELAKQPTMLSIDDKGENDQSDTKETSYAEDLINKDGCDSTESSLSRNKPEDLDQMLQDALEDLGGRAALSKLVRQWYGAKRKIGEHLLKHPDATVRDFPGIPKSTAALIRKVVLAEFARAILSLQPVGSK